MITGDNVLTAASVASSLRIVKKVAQVAILGVSSAFCLFVIAVLLFRAEDLLLFFAINH